MEDFMIQDLNNSVLVIDNSIKIKNSISNILKKIKSNIYETKNITEAKKILNTKQIDLVILELEISKNKGFDLINYIKEKINKELRIIVISKNHDKSVYKSCLKAGIAHFIKKPFDLEELEIKIDLCMDYIKKSHELKRTNQILQQYKNTVDSNYIVSKTNKEGYITYSNSQFEKISGYKKEELIGQSHNIIRHPEVSKDVFEKMWHTLKVEKKVWIGKIKNQSKNGNTYYVDTIINPILDENDEVIEYLAIRDDITKIEERKLYYKEQNKLTNEKFEDISSLSKLYKNALDKSSIILRFDTNKRITYINDLFCEVSGYTLDELVGKPYSYIVHPKINPEETKNVWKEIQAGNIWKGTLKNITKEGLDYHSIATIVPIKNKKGIIIEYMGIIKDITDIVKMHEELEETQREIIYKIGEIGETRSKETGQHVRRVAEYSKLLALKAGLNKKDAELLKHASPMHDIGKIGIADSILNKPGKLTFEEFETMKAHTQIGYEILKSSNREILKVSAIVANEHHEKWDGSGYPRGLKEDEIHIYGRITAIADVFDALGSNRPYKNAWNLDQILELFENEKGRHFDPYLTDLFLDNIDNFLHIRDSFR